MLRQRSKQRLGAKVVAPQVVQSLARNRKSIKHKVSECHSVANIGSSKGLAQASIGQCSLTGNFGE